MSDSFAECAVTFAERERIDVSLAKRQHREFECLLSQLGVEIVRLPFLPDHPDATFVEDTAIVLEDVAVISIPALESRQGEVATVAEALERYRPTRFLQGEARLEGGDVLRVGRQLFVGLSTRTNSQGITQLASLVSEFDYEVRAVEFQGCLHLKTACTQIGRDALLFNPNWIDAGQIGVSKTLAVDPSEPGAANALEINGIVLFPESFPRTRGRLEDVGFEVESVNISELQKAEAGVTCSTILFEA